MFRYHYLHHGVGWGILGFVVPLLFWGALIGLVILLFTRYTRSHSHPWHAPAPGWPAGGWPAPPGPSPTDSALEQARYRYARGDISRDEYFRLVTDLGGSPPAGPAGPPPPGPAGPPTGSAGSPPWDAPPAPASSRPPASSGPPTSS